MAIYMNGWATVEITDARINTSGGLEIQTKRTSAYNDGSGADTVGQMNWDGSFEHCAYFRADNGFSEVRAAAEPFLQARGQA